MLFFPYIKWTKRKREEEGKGGGAREENRECGRELLVTLPAGVADHNIKLLLLALWLLAV